MFGRTFTRPMPPATAAAETLSAQSNNAKGARGGRRCCYDQLDCRFVHNTQPTLQGSSWRSGPIRPLAVRAGVRLDKQSRKLRDFANRSGRRGPANALPDRSAAWPKQAGGKDRTACWISVEHRSAFLSCHTRTQSHLHCQTNQLSQYPALSRATNAPFRIIEADTELQRAAAVDPGGDDGTRSVSSDRSATRTCDTDRAAVPHWWKLQSLSLER